MNPETRQVAKHMREYGLSLFGRALYDVTFSEQFKPFCHASSVVLAAQAAEILIKARIAEEHPLLIFSKLPNISAETLLNIQELFADGKTYTYEALPNLLWATTGIKIDKHDEYKNFGKLRNNIAHFAVPDGYLADETLRFIIIVLEPLIHTFWKSSGIPHAVEWDDVIIEEGYLKERISRLGIDIDERINNIISPVEQSA
jgi:hypothetical protein